MRRDGSFSGGGGSAPECENLHELQCSQSSEGDEVPKMQVKRPANEVQP
ncbi:MAG: hypothetical protein MW690_001595 [Methanophagales archaeon]|nr:hypothetical protein [Methanophagales archaeon]